MEIRNYVTADAGMVIALWRDAGLKLSRSDNPAEMARLLERDPDLFLVAEEDGRIVGTILGRYDGRRGWIHHLAVDSEYRGEGLGTQLVAMVESRLRRLGCAKINLLILPANGGVQAFYEKLGYSSDELIFMEKWLR